MEQFRIEVADNRGSGHSFHIKVIDETHFQIFNDQQERMATIEIDPEDRHHYRQSLDCRLEIPLLDHIKDSIIRHEQPA